MWREQPTFADRRDAGRRLARALTPLELADPLVLALPRGGLPVAYEIAKALHAELDVLLVRKIGAPRDPELGLGAVVDGDPPELVLNAELVRALAPKAAYIEAERDRQLAEIARRRQLYGAGKMSVAGRNIILVDDGIATGGTVRAALAGLARQRPERVILAVPVAPEDTIDRLRPLCDDVVCLHTPELFRAVLCEFPDLDMIGYHRFPDNNPPALLEYGDASKREQFEFLAAYSPYQKVRPGTPYPAVLLMTGDADTRVPPLQARKMTARLQAATSSGRPVLLLYDTKAGHSGGKPYSKAIEDRARELTFLFWQLGLEPPR